MSETKLSAWQVLRNKYPATEYVLIEEVSDASGFSRSRSLDFMLINLWESRGLAITGIERKSFRGDWLKEVKNPKKQENHFRYCDYFCLLTDNENVAKLEEIPVNWGWWHINEKGMLKVMKAAPKLDSVPVPRTLLCSMLRRAASKENYVHVDTIQERLNIARENGKNERVHENQRILREAEANQKLIFDFESESGIKLGSWDGINPKKAGAAMKFIAENGLEGIKKDIERATNTMSANLKRLNETLEIL